MVGKKNVITGLAILAFCVLFVGAASVFGGINVRTLGPNIYYVNVISGDDDNGGLSLRTAFRTIQRGIETASDGDLILVYPGEYQGEVDFLGKAIVVQGVVVSPAGVPVLQNPGDFAVSFYLGEGRDSILMNFVIRNSFMGVFVAGSSPTLKNLTIVDNKYGIEAYSGSEPDISNTIFWNNAGGDLFGYRARYCCINPGIEGEGNVEGDPLLADPSSGDYHILSERGRYWPEHDVWILDPVSSPCIDAGDPNADPADEPRPNGGLINMGAYGGTVQASLSPSGQPGVPGQASDPNPADGDIHVSPDTMLSWTAGENAVLHLVYFGTDLSPPLISLESNQTITEHHPKMEFDPGPLDLDTTYFWRIDEVNGTDRTTGTLWSFSIPSSSPKGRTCFTGETGVWVDGALIPISSVNIGECVGRMNMATVNCSLTYFGHIRERQEHEGVFACYDIVLESGNCITVAENHYFLTESGLWVALHNLTAGMRLQTPNGSVGVVSVIKRTTPYIGKVYNLRIEGSNRYFVGKDAVIVRDY